jgi:hypothetical protein
VDTLDAAKVAMMLFAEDQDVVAQSLEADGRLPHVLGHLIPARRSFLRLFKTPSARIRVKKIVADFGEAPVEKIKPLRSSRTISPMISSTPTDCRCGGVFLYNDRKHDRCCCPARLVQVRLVAVQPSQAGLRIHHGRANRLL